MSAAEKLNISRKEVEKVNKPEISDELRAYIEEKIEARRAAKAAKNYAEADAIRAELTAKGITLIDTKAGTEYTVEA